MEGEKGMTSREKILSKLSVLSNMINSSSEENTTVVSTEEKYKYPDLDIIDATVYASPIEKFIDAAKNISGAKVVESEEDGDFNKLVKSLYPEAKTIGSHLPYISADINPDSAENAAEMMKVDVGVVEGKIGVAENGCIWVPQTMKHRSIMFACENLVIILKRKDILNNMHEAYAKIADNPEYFDTYKFATFISGPSKTADIESALVYGAQAARSVSVILT